MSREATSGILIDEDLSVSFAELCRYCAIDAGLVIDMVNEGMIEPAGDAPESWEFHGLAVRRAQVAARLIRDLEINLAGAALAIDLLEELEDMRGGWLYR
ncbi:MAG: MerR family transcriptional regulator [Gammaproteobacteria bacterium]|nr:MerR family transcriptional regulator [Gammaproteobacteria bacterium]